MFENLRNNILNRSINQFIAGKNGSKMPDLEKLTSAIVILEDLDKQTVRTIEDRFKAVFGTSRIRIIIITENTSDDVLLSDQYCEVTTKDFGVIKVLKSEKQEEIRKLPMTQLLVNMAKSHLDISDYLATLPHANFRVSFTKGEHFQLYDLIIDSGDNSNTIRDIEALYNYLKVLSGESKPINRLRTPTPNSQLLTPNS
jgi:hypothetical protein